MSLDNVIIGRVLEVEEEEIRRLNVGYTLTRQ